MTDGYEVGHGVRDARCTPPYSQVLTALWKFRTPEQASQSAAAMLAKFWEYHTAGDFVGMDIARKFLEMAFLTARRYAHRRHGLTYGEGMEVLPPEPDADKERCAEAFAAALAEVLAVEDYREELARRRGEERRSRNDELRRRRGLPPIRRKEA